MLKTPQILSKIYSEPPKDALEKNNKLEGILSKNPQLEKINALNGAPKMVQQMNQKALAPDPGPKGRPGTRVLGPKGPRGPALFGSSAGLFLALHSGH